MYLLAANEDVLHSSGIAQVCTVPSANAQLSLKALSIRLVARSSWTLYRCLLVMMPYPKPSRRILFTWSSMGPDLAARSRNSSKISRYLLIYDSSS
jgi:hypothetical protein